MRRGSIRRTATRENTVGTVGEEKTFNPRLQVKSADEYVLLMNNLSLDNLQMMDVAIPDNMQRGLHQEDVARLGCGNFCERQWDCR